PGRRRRITGTVLLVWSAILALRGVGLADSLVWPLALAGAGVAIGAGATTWKLGARKAQVIAVVLIVAGVAVFVGNNTGDSATSLVAPGAVAVALLLVVGPWAYHLVRERNEEHAARVREQERAELAARVHDSVLQTLTLIQKNPNNARTLAHQQKHKLHAWQIGRASCRERV